MFRLVKYFIFFLIVFFETSNRGFAQPKDLDPEKWAIELDKKDYSANKSARQLDSTLSHSDSITVVNFLSRLQEIGKSKGDYFQARFNCIKARQLFFLNAPYQQQQRKYPNNLDRIKTTVNELFSSAMDIAYKEEDDYLVAFVSYAYAITIMRFKEVGVAVMYAKNSVDLDEKLSLNIPPGDYQFLAEILYAVREYNDCINYGKKAVMGWQKLKGESDLHMAVTCMNTVALGYHRQQKYDSALIFYNQALQLAAKANDTAWSSVWKGIVSGNIGQIFYAQRKYDTAYALLKLDYTISKKAGYYDNAANSLQWAARTDLARGNKEAALAEVREAFQLLKLWPDENYLRNTYYTATQIFRQIGFNDSAFFYNNLYSTLNDSLEKLVATSNLAISTTRLNDERNKYNIISLQREKHAQIQQRNLIIAAIIFIAAIALLIINRQRLKLKYRQKLLEQDKLRVEQEMESARMQLQMFTQNIVEKTNLIEKLEQQVKANKYSSDEYQLIEELSDQTILTEDDWLKFKILFEKTHIGFFTKLKQQVNDITLAEQRMAALTRLHLTTKQMAAILGISSNSVIKAKQRLRQRFNVQTDVHVEEFLSKL